MGKKAKLSNAERLVDLHRSSHVSRSALSAILRNIRDNGLPGATSRASQLRAHADLGATPTPHGTLIQDHELPLKDGSTFTISIQSPSAMLYATVMQCEPFRAFMRELLAEHPPSTNKPWHIIIYFDGITPTDGLSKKKDRRGVEAFYWSFLEFGAALCMEELWFTCAAIRTVVVKDDVQAGMSHFVRFLLEKAFFNPDGCDIERHGVILDVSESGDSSELATVIAKHHVTVADEKALKDVLMNKGHAGTKPCPICRDLITHKSGYAHHDASASLRAMTDLDIDSWRKHTDQSVRNLVTRLGNHWALVESGEVAPEKHNEMTQFHGWNYNPLSLILMPRYCAISTLSFDWMHVWAVDGIFGREIRVFMKKFHDAKRRGAPAILAFSDFHAYLQRWRWPRAIASAASVCETGDFAASASEALSAAPVLEKYVREVILGLPQTAQFQDAAMSFILCCKAFLTHQDMSRGAATQDELRDNVLAYLRQHQVAHGDAVWTFKHHMALHLISMRSYLFGCWTHERKHRSVKRFVKAVHNTRHGYERSLMQNLTAQHLHELKSFSLNTGLIGSRPATEDVLKAVRDMLPGVVSVRVSVEAKYSGARICRGDVVLLGAAMQHAAGDVWMHVEVEPASMATGPLTIMTVHPICRICVERKSCQYLLGEHAQNPRLIQTSHIICGASAYRFGGRSLTALWPTQYRVHFASSATA
jgi:hypothetical protein